jgi:hypothetical protein
VGTVGAVSTPSVIAGGGPVAGAVAAVAVPAQDPAPPPGQGPEFGKASPVALVVILLLALATVFLIRSMSKRIRRLPASFDDPQAGGTTGAAADGPEADPPAEGPAPGTTERRDPAKDSSG